MTNTGTLIDLLAQHDHLRAIMSRCEQLADELDVGCCSGEPLAREIVRLRVAFDLHNQAEEQQLRPILHDADAFGDARIERMIAEHVDEHREMRRRFAIKATSELRETLAMLRDHLAAEERYFLSARIVRDDLVVVEGGG